MQVGYRDGRAPKKGEHRFSQGRSARRLFGVQKTSDDRLGLHVGPA